MNVGILLVVHVALSSCSSIAFAGSPQQPNTPIPQNYGTIPLTVLDEKGRPFNSTTKMLVRLSNSSYTDDFQDGVLMIPPCDPDAQIIAVWVEGYDVAFRKCNEQSMMLGPLDVMDNRYYSWISAIGSCNECHARQKGDGYNEMNEWLKSGHYKMFSLRHFETMYRGTNMSGMTSPQSEWKLIGNDLVKLPPIIDDKYFGPGYRLDFPQLPGNCVYCHVPTAVPASQESVNLDNYFPFPAGVMGEGVTCDVCHKVFDVTLNDQGFPFVDRPGVLSYKFLRPSNGVFMTGPFANIVTNGSEILTDHHLACSSVFSRSEFCAPCHFGKFGDMVIYNSYGEWKTSPFAANPEGSYYRTCQDCHMSHLEVGRTDSLWSQRQACSADNTQFQNFDHNVMNFDEGKGIPQMVRGAAEVKVDFSYQPESPNTLNLITRVTNTRAGHKFPTDSPLRHLILVVEARDRLGTPLVQVAGERIPNWGGVEKSNVNDAKLIQAGVRDYSGQPGRIFANLLVEEDTNISPTAAYWNETKYAFVNLENGTNSDTRLPPGVAVENAYSFSLPDAGEVVITVKLAYRFAFFSLMAQKEWFDRPDIVVAQVECEGPPAQLALLALSCKQVEP